MDNELKLKLQQQVSSIPLYYFEDLHRIKDIPIDFTPWGSNLSPSALYNCSLKCRKEMGLSAPEVKWISIKRWVTTTPSGIDLPDGVFYSIKRHEAFDARATPPQFIKTEFIILLLPHGNVWSQVKPGVPITEEWLFQESDNVLILERLLRKDAVRPIIGYVESVYKYLQVNPDQVGIHLKRRKLKND